MTLEPGWLGGSALALTVRCVTTDDACIPKSVKGSSRRSSYLPRRADYSTLFAGLSTAIGKMSWQSAPKRHISLTQRGFWA